MKKWLKISIISSILFWFCQGLSADFKCDIPKVIKVNLPKRSRVLETLSYNSCSLLRNLDPIESEVLIEAFEMKQEMLEFLKGNSREIDGQRYSFEYGMALFGRKIDAIFLSNGKDTVGSGSIAMLGLFGRLII